MAMLDQAQAAADVGHPGGRLDASTSVERAIMHAL
jgi:hypothetical protein